MLHDERRGPGGVLIAWLPPELLAGFGIQRDDEVIPLVIPVDDDRLSEQPGRAALAERVPRAHPAQVLLPLQIPLEVIAMEAARAEVGEDVLAIGDGGMG